MSRINLNAEDREKALEYWRPAVETIREDAIHGSVYLANQALDIVEDFVQRQLYRNRTELIQNLAKLSNALVRAKPLMALIYNRTKRVLQFIQNLPKEEKNIQVIKELTLEEIQRIRTEAEENFQKIARLGSRLILDYHVVLTHSSSSIIEAIFMEARKQKKRFRVIVTESRPLLEGRDLARRLAEAGIKTRLIPDADITRAVKDAHFVLTGTDRFTETSFINKTGTHAIGIIAEYMNKPFYVAGETDKILLRRTYPVRFLQGDPSQLIENPPKALSVDNYYFEETPIDFLQKVVIEDGIFELKEFVDRYL